MLLWAYEGEIHCQLQDMQRNAVSFGYSVIDGHDRKGGEEERVGVDKSQRAT